MCLVYVFQCNTFFCELEFECISYTNNDILKRDHIISNISLLENHRPHIRPKTVKCNLFDIQVHTCIYVGHQWVAHGAKRKYSTKFCYEIELTHVTCPANKLNM